MKRKSMKAQDSHRPATPHRPLTDAERSEVVTHCERLAREPQAPRFKGDGKGLLAWVDGVDPDLHVARIAAAFGTGDRYAINALSCQAAETSDGSEAATKYNTAAALSAGIQPQNAIEGMLTVQMVGCHNLAMAMLRRASKTDRVDFLAVYGNLATKFLRTFTLQTEALARLRGQTGRQTVRVEHVTVQAGGQAVVGAVSTGGGVCEDKQTNTPCTATAWPIEAWKPERRSDDSAAMWGADAPRDTVPGTVRARAIALPDARRRTWQRGTDGKPQCVA